MACEGFVLPIRRKGLFAQDAFFSDIKDEFNDVIKDTLRRWDSKGSSGIGDRWTAYRRLRSHDRKDEDEKVASVTQTDESVVIAVDMSDFVNGQIDMRTEGQSAIVEASLGSKMSYKRRFPLPRNVNVDGVVAAMSDDGILTITAPRKDRKVSVKPDVGASGGASSVSTTKNVQATSFQSSSQTQGGNGRVIPLTVEDSQASAAETKVSTEQSSNLKSIQEELERQILRGDTQSATTGSTQETSSVSSSSTSSSRRVLPILRKGRFFKDSFFKDVQGDFESALGNIIKRWDDDDSFSSSTSAPPPSTFSRRITESQVLDGGCTSGITATDDTYKVIVDMGDYADGKIGVKAVEGAVIVTGETKGEAGTTTFSKSFALPGVKDAAKVDAALSTDGVLTVTAPKT
ncbi:uncharacterized protein LOC143040653 [Oratosquilla oratoria]|uniref:uncharacterized protein LOC143040653 n=1 Tax=Oratosquilla oratoria TaxID=337810 RepID=UPI003F763EC0